MKNKFIIIILLVASLHAETDKNEYKLKAKNLLKAYGTHIASVAAHQLTLYTLSKIALKMGASVQQGQTSDVAIIAWPLFLGLTVCLPEFQNKKINAIVSAAAPLCALAECALLGKYRGIG